MLNETKSQKLLRESANFVWARLVRRLLKRYPKVVEIQEFLKCSKYFASKLHKYMSVYTTHTCYDGHDCTEVFTEGWD